MSLTVILLVSFSLQCVMSVPTVTVSVRREQNVSLPCDSNYTSSGSMMAWYRLNSEKITLLVSAMRGNVQKDTFIVEHNEERSRFRLDGDSRLENVSLVISAVREADLGLYFCAVGVSLNKMLFGTAVRLTFAGAEQRRHTSDGVGCWSLWPCVCITCGICGFLCAGVLCYRKNSSVVSCISCVKENSNVQAAQVQYSSLRFIRRSRAAAPAPENVTYATIAKHTP
ncbi:hypothetical protein ABG768_011351 [Culter alburnus]|uniref:Ig-like domain-containing protein n=1 Tax=Culter alburnus TaxID=194366 RepID=A0AAW1Z6V1_CULAL